MPLSSFGVAVPTAPVGEYGTVSCRVDGVEINLIKDVVFSHHFLTPTDPVRLSIVHDTLAPEVRKLLVAGSSFELYIDETQQFGGILEEFNFHMDRHGGTTVEIGGRDTMSRVVDGQIDPDHHYPNKTPLEKLLRDILVGTFQFEDVVFSNAENVEVAANRALKQKRGGSKHRRRPRRNTGGKGPPQLSLPKTKPEHNDTYYQFLSRILNHEGLWLWPSVDGKKAIVGAPDYDQEPIGQLRRIVGGLNNNIISGGIRVDTAGQPSFIVARGAIPPTVHEHFTYRVVIGNPMNDPLARLVPPAPDDGESTETPSEAAILASGGSGSQGFLLDQRDAARKAIERQTAYDNSVKEILSAGSVIENPSLTSAHETGTSITPAERTQVVPTKNTKYTPAKPIRQRNIWAPLRATPVFLKDRHSHTVDQLERFVRKQMSLYTRKAFVASYTFQGFYLDGAIPQPDTIINVIDEPAQFEGNLWVLSRTIRQSRSGGTTTTLELLLPGALQF